jgi:hypothetical protein
MTSVADGFGVIKVRVCFLVQVDGFGFELDCVSGLTIINITTIHAFVS